MPEPLNFKLGTSLDITVVLDEESPDSVKITIEDASGVEEVTDVNMTEITTKVFTYTFQSDEQNVQGIYKAIIEVIKGNYTSISTVEFELYDVSSTWRNRH